MTVKKLLKSIHIDIHYVCAFKPNGDYRSKSHSKGLQFPMDLKKDCLQDDFFSVYKNEKVDTFSIEETFAGTALYIDLK